MGLRVPLEAVIVGLVLIGILAGAFSCISNAIGLATKSEDALAPLVNSLALPILLLSGILLPMTLAPRWLQILSDVNPFKHIVDALRAVFRGEITTPVVLIGVALTVLLAVVGGWVGGRAVVRQTK
jgi:ABC-2 type transport system permease protein